jgi:sulfopyruvate decarboxylase TPP-binding subunit
VASACGAAFAGRRPAVYMEATGLVAGMYSLESTAIQFGLPVVLLVSYVGSPGDHGTSGAFATFGRFAEAQVRALALPLVVFETADRLEDRVRGLVEVAAAAKLPAVGLFSGEFTRRPSSS